MRPQSLWVCSTEVPRLRVSGHAGLGRRLSGPVAVWIAPGGLDLSRHQGDEPWTGDQPALSSRGGIWNTSLRPVRASSSRHRRFAPSSRIWPPRRRHRRCAQRSAAKVCEDNRVSPWMSTTRVRAPRGSSSSRCHLRSATPRSSPASSRTRCPLDDSDRLGARVVCSRRARRTRSARSAIGVSMAG